jgi:hypothetical protein
MKSTRTALLAALMLLGPVFCTADPAAPQSAVSAGVDSPRLEVSETEFDFGRVPQGVSVSHVFWLKNTGGNTLRIDEVKPGCGCTRAPLDKHELVPGDSTRVELIFSTGHYSSNVRKSAKILCNAEGEIPRLTIVADVREDMGALEVFTADPYTVELDTGAGETSAPQTYEIALKNLSDGDLSWSLVSRPDEYVDVGFSGANAAAKGGAQTLTVSLSNAAADAAFEKSLTVEASDPNHTRLTIPITKTVAGNPMQTSQR